jgi:hypothetical protein
MSTIFKQFLQEKAPKYLAQAEAGRAEIEEWRDAINRLYSKFREWLNQAAPQGVIEIKESDQEINEPGLGRYCVPRLDLRVLGTWIGIIPKARRTVGTAKPPRKGAPERADGRIDITDEVRRYVLYRFRNGDDSDWVIDGLDHPHDVSEETLAARVQFVPRYDPQPLDQEAFERALMSYLR